MTTSANPFPTVRIRHILDANESGVWGDDPVGVDDVAVLRSTDQTVDGRWSIESPAMRHLSDAELSTKTLRLGDLVVTKSSGSSRHIGKTTIVNDEVASLGAAFGNFMQRLRTGPSFDPKFLWYLLNIDLVRFQFDDSSNSTTGLANLNGTIIGNARVPAPPIETQRVIADYLDRETAQIDTLIEEQQRLVAMLRERRGAVIESACARGVDAVEDVKPSGLVWNDRVPSHWRVANIRRFAEMRSGHTPSRSKPEYWESCHIPWFTLADVWQIRDGKRKYLDGTTNLISDLGLANSAADLLPAGTVVLSRTASVGFTGIMPVPMATSQDFWNWIPGPDLDGVYLMWVFRAMRREFDAFMIGSTHKTIYQPTAAAFRIPVPPLDEQRRIAAHLDEQTAKIDALIAEAERFIELSRERRSALITAAVTGQIDVREGTA